MFKPIDKLNKTNGKLKNETECSSNEVCDYCLPYNNEYGGGYGYRCVYPTCFDLVVNLSSCKQKDWCKCFYNKEACK